MGNTSVAAPPFRTVKFGRYANQGLYLSNEIYTTKYTYLNFIPYAVFLQFLYPRNFIFLANAILQSIRAISNLSPVTAILPLIAVLLISVIREGYQDYKRRRRDAVVNQTLCYVLDGGTFVEKQWQQVQVGDYVAVQKGKQIPADLILLQSSDIRGTAYVETSNLDGERNLKMKHSIFQSKKLYPNQLQQLRGVAEVDPPNQRISIFDGVARVENFTVPLTEQNLLLRGTSLQNIEEGIGLVIYAGMDTKIMRNLGKIRTKINRFEYMINWIQLVLAVFLILMCITSAVVYRRIWAPFDGSRRVFYLYRVAHYGVDGEAALQFLSAFILLNAIIPLSLNISIELIAAFQSDVFENDIRMSQYIQGERIYCTINDSRIIPELSIVQYVLTDKTGTLTSNELELKGVFVGNQTYTVSQMSSSLPNSPQFARFWLLVLICNDVITDSATGEYQGSSLDEVCFLNYAQTIGYKFVRRELNNVYLQIRGQQQVIQIVHIIPFDERKMMSVLFKDPAGGGVILSTKGADSSIVARSSSNPSVVNQVNVFSKSGYRTLVFAQKRINQGEASTLISQIQRLKQMRANSQVNRQQYFQRYSSIVAKVENNLKIVGVTAIQDKLQEGVPDTIRNFRMAGIQVAMITGDKLQTAQNIGYLSNFIDQNAQIFRIKAGSSVEKQVTLIQGKIRYLPQANYSVIIQGESIQNCINNPNLLVQQSFANIIRRCGSVIFCRSTPSQKGFVVQFYKRFFKDIVVAIGDGGNDVRMIQQADIGVGILGREGNQASSAADFSICQFRFIQRLILHHGRWTLYRMAFFFNYFGFKVMILTVILFCYLAYCGQSGTSLFANGYIASYNAVLTVVLPIIYAVYQQDINMDMYPQVTNYLPIMYRDFKKLQIFSYWRYFLWSLAGVLYGIWIFFTTLYVLDSRTATDSHGRIPDQYSVSMNLELTLYFFVTLLILFQIHTFNVWIWFAALFLTLVMAMIFFIIQTFANIDDAYYSLVNNFNLRFWLLLVVNSVFGPVIKYLLLALDYALWPNSTQVSMLQRNFLTPPTVQRLSWEFAKLPGSTTLSSTNVSPQYRY